MVTDKYELAIDLDNGEWICDVTENDEEGVMTFSLLRSHRPRSSKTWMGSLSLWK